ncbi:hypothetical protein HYH03_015705 [Edaphochlamys debaryana]|uniref:TOG domain-containing protein n=1 Tax=Edaphochlamys debaryana TaxID=47281 RepID=A0A835XLB8_9CHLO|nr:hypothetical protein HYH03_015705 [Edaphochlamys debaryana]|eukprot:KAG2485535.1 hypothetical protein HYH03_015705 [Edaphochlamys debaryana]
MGSLFSKDKKDKQKQDERKTVGSAPTRLEGLDGTTPPVPAKRALTPEGTSRAKEGLGVNPVGIGGAGDSPSPASTASDQRPGAVAVPGTAPDLDGGVSPSQEPLTPSRRAPMRTDYVGEQSDGAGLAADLPATNVQVPDDCLSWIPVLGDNNVRGMFASDWKTREHALQAVTRSLGNARFNAEHAPEDIWKTTCLLLDRALKDKVAPLYHAALELLAMLVSTYAGQLKKEVLTSCLEPLMHTLLHRVGNNNSRIQEASIQALLTLANQPPLGLGFLAQHALSPIPKKSSQGAAATAQMAGRLELITCMLNVQAQQQMGFGVAGRSSNPQIALNANAIDGEEVVRFTRPALDMPDDKVRTAAVRVVAEVYRSRKASGHPFEVEKLLGAGVKPALLQVLHRRFAEVDEEVAGGVVGGASGGIPGVSGVSASGRTTNPDDMPVGPGISIKASGSFNKGSALPPIGGGRYGSLPSLAVVGSRGGSRTGPGGPLGSLDPVGKPPRTPVTPGSAAGRSRTPPRTGGSREGGIRAASPMHGGSPLRNSRGTDGVALLPGTMPGEAEPDVMMIHSGTSTPVRGSSSQSVRHSNSLKARGRASGGTNLDDAEEQLIEYILNDEARAAS